jgi:hypothetical protein
VLARSTEDKGTGQIRPNLYAKGRMPTALAADIPTVLRGSVPLTKQRQEWCFHDCLFFGRARLPEIDTNCTRR